MWVHVNVWVWCVWSFTSILFFLKNKTKKYLHNTTQRQTYEVKVLMRWRGVVTVGTAGVTAELRLRAARLWLQDCKGLYKSSGLLRCEAPGATVVHGEGGATAAILWVANPVVC